MNACVTQYLLAAHPQVKEAAIAASFTSNARGAQLGSTSSQIAILISNHNLNTAVHGTTVDTCVVGDWICFAVVFCHNAGGVHAACD